MPEGMNVEVAHKLSEREGADRHKHRWEEAAEILEVLVLAIAAIAAALDRLPGRPGRRRQSMRYREATRDRFAADAAATVGGQQLVTAAPLPPG